jgi:hypothetical protein
VDPEHRRYFLVERYIPSIAIGSVEAATRRLATRPSGSARHVVTVLVATEETCLSVFEAVDEAAVAAVNAQADFPLERIVELDLVVGPDSG